MVCYLGFMKNTFLGNCACKVIGTQERSEQKMANNFKRIFGNEEEVIVCFGDYEQKQHMKFKEPTKGKGMRTLFRRAGFQTHLVDEFRKSRMCSQCELGICKKSIFRKSPYRKKISYSQYTDCFVVRTKNAIVIGIEM